MLFEDSYTTISSNGSITINLLDELVVQIEPWHKCLAMQVLSGGAVEEGGDEIVLVEKKYNHNTTCQMRFVQTIPEKIRYAVSGIRFLQYKMLRFAAEDSRAADLLLSSRTLLWLLLYEQRVNGFDEDWLDFLLNRKRHEILQSIFGWSTTSRSMARIINKIQLQEGAKKELEAIYHICAQPEKLMRLRHLNPIPVHLLQIWKEYPVVDHTQYWRHFQVEHYAGGYAAARISANKYQQLLDEVREIAYFLGAVDDVRQRLSACATIGCIQRIHDQLTQQVNRERSEHDLAAMRKHYRYFPPPPLTGNSSIEPITDIDTLIEEGRIMNHCVTTYAPRIVKGESYIYRVLKPQRATLELNGLDSSKPTIKQLKLKSNQEPSAETWEAVHVWIDANTDI
jgi:hypothetical protein